MKKSAITLATVLFGSFSASVSAQTSYVEEDPVYIRFEQYTGASGILAFWRLPSPGASTFPGGTCKALTIPGDHPEHTSRFMALYLFAKTNNKKVFYIYNTSTCSIVSFGSNG